MKKNLGLALLALMPFLAYAGNAVPATEENTKKIIIELPEVPKNIKVKVSGLVQAQYVYSHASGGNESDQNGFSIRRSSIGVSADVGDGWSGKVVYEFDSSSSGADGYNDYIDTAIISKKFDQAGTLTIGHKKTHFMLEEYSLSSKFLCLERSINSNFVTANKYAKGLAGYHIGAFFDGNLGNLLDYGISLTNAVGKDYDKRSNDLAFTANLGYTFKFEEDVKLYFGVNATANFGNDGAKRNDPTNTKETLPSTNPGHVYGVEPYLIYTHGGFTGIFDFYYIDGSNSSKIKPFYGLNLTLAYRLNFGLEPAFRVTYLNTDSGKVNANVQNRVPNSGVYDNAMTYYLGANYYFNKYVKLAAGYEYGHYFGGRADRKTADSSTFRTMLQISF